MGRASDGNGVNIDSDDVGLGNACSDEGKMRWVIGCIRDPMVAVGPSR